MASIKQMKDATLADKLGQLKALQADINQQLKEVKEEINRRGLREGMGQWYMFTCPVTHSQRIDSKTLQSLVTPGMLRLCQKEVRSQQWHVHARSQSDAA